MKKLECSKGARITAVLLAALTLFLAAVSGFGIALIYELELYSYELDEAKESYIDGILYGYAYRIADAYRTGYVFGDTSQAEAKQNMMAVIYEKNLDFELRRDGVAVYKSYAGHAPQSENIKRIPVLDSNDGEYSVTFYVHASKKYVDPFVVAEEWIPVLHSIRYWIIVICAVSALLSFLCWLFALSAAGKRRESEGYVMTMFDKVPLDIIAVAAFFAVIAEIMIYEYNCDIGDVFVATLICVYAFVDSIIITLLSMTAKVRIMTKTFISNNVITRLLKLMQRLLGYMWRFAVKAAKLAVRVIRTIPFFWRTLLTFTGMFAVSFVIAGIISSHDDIGAVMFFIFWAVVITGACYAGWNMTRLKTGAQRISKGDLDYKIDTQYLLFDFREHAENLNSIGDGMALAVEERMRGERFKTELITNVSHDIKTPITSIISYVDLLKKCDIENEDAKGYIEVLDRQAAKLKKLTEDLVTASKASSGVVTVDAKPCELGILVGQAAGEYEEKLTAAGLHLIVNVPEHPVTIMADGKLMWRVFDNLMSNVVKYSLPGSRVYFTLAEADGVATVTLSNISREPLMRGADELTERFVRGDESRHTEGSGLGLSIAKSFVELQGGTLTVTSDADLFRVTVRMKSAECRVQNVKKT